MAECWGALAFDQVNAQAAHEAGVSKHWIGSDIGWMIFGAGMLAAVVGAGVFAFALRGVALPATLRLFVGVIGIGILAADLFGPGPLLVGAPVIVLYGIGWISLPYGRSPRLRRTRRRRRSELPTECHDVHAQLLAFVAYLPSV